jgi:hypothetical protein
MHKAREANMSKLRIALFLGLTAAMTVAGVLMWKAEATPLTGAADSLAVIKGYSAVQKAWCGRQDQEMPLPGLLA